MMTNSSLFQQVKLDNDFHIAKSTQLTRSACPVENSKAKNSFLVPMTQRKYLEQYSNLYLSRLNQLRCVVLEQGRRSWDGMVRNSISVKHSDKVLDVGKNKISWAVGTIYREMRLKPSILEEVTVSVCSMVKKKKRSLSNSFILAFWSSSSPSNQIY